MAAIIHQVIDFRVSFLDVDSFQRFLSANREMIAQIVAEAKDRGR